MKGAIGVFNGNSRNSEYVRECQAASIPQQTQTEYEWLTALADHIAIRYEYAVNMTKTGLVAKGNMLAAEFERQLQLLAEYADEVVEVMG